jgi:hypothetical protein
MTNLDFTLRGFSFKMRDWAGAIDVEFEDENCAVLVGINAGGKTLAMTVLRKFSELLDNPTAMRKKYFEQFARKTGVESISVSFSYDLLDTEGDSKVGWIQEEYFEMDDAVMEKLKDFLGVRKQDKTIVLDFEDGPQGSKKIKIVVETKVTIEDLPTEEDEAAAIYERRHGLEVSVSLLSLTGRGMENIQRSGLVSVDHWKSVFTNEDELEGMFSYGPPGGRGDWCGDLRKHTGLKFESDNLAEGFEHWDPSRAISFKTLVPEMLEVSGAYGIHDEGWDEIVEMENRFAKEGKIAELFESVYNSELDKQITGLEKVLELVGSDVSVSYEKLHGLCVAGIDSVFLTEHNGERASQPLLDETGLPLHVPLEAMEALTMTENTFSQWLALRSFKGFFKDLKILKQNNYLSSGQKRILGMFSTLMVLRPGSTVLIDEPELSLHIDWQRNLISALIDGFQHLTFVFATHSPDVIMNHPEKVIAVPPSEKV